MLGGYFFTALFNDLQAIGDGGKFGQCWMNYLCPVVLQILEIVGP